MTDTVVERTYSRRTAAPHSRLAKLLQRDLAAGSEPDAPRHTMTAAANPATSRSLALALSAELLDDPAAGRSAQSYRPRKRRPAPSPAPAATPAPAPETEPAASVDATATMRADEPAPAEREPRPTGHAPVSLPEVICLPSPDTIDRLDAEAATVIEMPGTIAPSTALVPVAPAREPRPLNGDKQDLVRELRRTWMSAAFKKTPHCLLLVRLRPAIKIRGGYAPDLAHPSMVNILHTLGEIGPVFAVDDSTAAIVLSKITLHQAVRIGQAVASAVDQSTADGHGEPVLFSAGIAAMYRDDDPVTVMLLAERCLALASGRDDSAVVGENEPAIRHARLR